MTRRIFALSFLSLLFFPSFSSSTFAETKEPPSSSVTLPLNEFEELKEKIKTYEEGPSVLTVEEISISGSMGSGQLKLEYRGRTTGKRKTGKFVDISGAARLRSCTGNAIIHRAGRGYSLLPSVNQFKGSCQLVINDQDEVSLRFGISVLDAKTNVKDADITEQTQGDQSLHLSLTRRQKVSQRPGVKEGKISIIPRYRLTVTSDDVHFFYRLTLSNPNRRPKKFLLPLRNSESISNVETKAAHQITEEGLQFTLRPGTTHASFSGQIPHAKFVPLLDTEEQYLLLEFHPLVSLKLLKQVPRISIDQTGMTPTYRAAMAFLIGKGKEVTWDAKVREVFASQSMAAQSANYTVYVPRRGPPLVDGKWTLTNQGQTSLKLPLPGTPIFASAEGVPQVLAKTDKNELILPLRQGHNDVRLQYELEEKQMPFILGTWKTKLAKPQTEMPTSSVQVQLDTRHRVFATSLMSTITYPWFNAEWMVWLLVLASLWAWLLVHIGLQRNSAIFSGFGLLIVGHLISGFSTLILFLGIATLLAQYRHPLLSWLKGIRHKKLRWWILIPVSLVAFVLVLSFLTFMTTSLRSSKQELSRASSQLKNNIARYEEMDEDYGGAKKEMSIADAGLVTTKRRLRKAPRGKVDSYLGLPVERVIPSTRQYFYLSERAVAPDSNLTLRIFSVSYLAYVLLGLIFLLIWFTPIAMARKAVADRVWRTTKH